MNPLSTGLAETTTTMPTRQHGQRPHHDSSDEDGQELPSFDGTLTNLNSWLDDLNDSEHLLDAEIITLLRNIMYIAVEYLATVPASSA